VVIWQAGERRLEVHVDGQERAAVLVDGTLLLGAWPLPPRPGVGKQLDLPPWAEGDEPPLAYLPLVGELP
jgi:hypothetical protein